MQVLSGTSGKPIQERGNDMRNALSPECYPRARRRCCLLRPLLTLLLLGRPRAVAQAITPPSSPSLVAWFPFDENLRDYTGNGNNGSYARRSDSIISVLGSTGMNINAHVELPPARSGQLVSGLVNYSFCFFLGLAPVNTYYSSYYAVPSYRP